MSIRFVDNIWLETITLLLMGRAVLSESGGLRAGQARRQRSGPGPRKAEHASRSAGLPGPA